MFLCSAPYHITAKCRWPSGLPASERSENGADWHSTDSNSNLRTDVYPASRKKRNGQRAMISGGWNSCSSNWWNVATIGGSHSRTPASDPEWLRAGPMSMPAYLNPLSQPNSPWLLSSHVLGIFHPSFIIASAHPGVPW